MLAHTRQQLDTLRQDTRRFAAIYSALRQRVFKSSGRFRPYVNEAMLEDACSDAIMSVVVQHQGGFEVDAPGSAQFDDALLGYLFRAAQNHLMTSLRRDTRARDLFFTPTPRTADDDSKSADPLEHAVDPAATPDETVAASEQSRLVHECLQALSELARDTFKLALRGFNDVEIQTALKVASPATVRRRVHDAKNLMMACIQAKTEGQACLSR